MNRAGILFLVLPVICLADAGVLDYVEPILNTPVVATSPGYVVSVLEEQGWTSIEADYGRVDALRVGDGRDERLTFTFSPTAETPTEIHQDILEVEYTYVPWLEVEESVERVKEEFNRLVAAFEHLIGAGVSETSEAGWGHSWPDRDSSRIELLLEPMWDTCLTVSVNLEPLRVPESD